MAKKDDLEKQYELGLNEPWTNRYWKFRSKIDQRFQRFEKYRFMKQSFVWLFVVMAILVNALIYDYYVDIQSTLPEAVPLLNNYIQLSPRLITLDELSLLPILTTVTTFVLIVTSIRLYNRKPYYSLLVLMILSVALTGVLINLVNLASQYL